MRDLSHIHLQVHSPKFDFACNELSDSRHEPKPLNECLFFSQWHDLCFTLAVAQPWYQKEKEKSHKQLTCQNL